ncbi:hypothetical protein ACFSMW_00955 [Virgibacillus halophilus]|uniref:Uncharacterized protein n=1 Tax=Tigheibacillus halophilus TaxID=361280 RepID=A0ABU5C9I0_9BACI|nr:hypothetical protein [Virgibacillus halophilus]
MRNKKEKSRMVPIVIGFVSAVPAGILANVYDISFFPRIMLSLVIAAGLWFTFQFLSRNFSWFGQKEQ